ncbi:DNTP-hexose dehydratase-epimerase [Halobacteriovorax marinus SJ]|uniref:DNTP-hexose dehydratase-epimerase n=1 Tax=Halobacteriovorax marinus (strain ATCC BAA-682 / DSM 15412 / SJ) TaxID=862908 RepID=E1X3V8_HALMS|nr:GDP-mannose 4,6-dehydratase [Halobacteriovorax marinus]CBW25298.1 DNTP-hexose dehydratase-epimerase [Halobacteriovorax marinus SJ]
MKYLITGGCGFLGSNLAAEVLKRGDELVIFDNLYRHGTEKNLEWLRSLGEFKFYRNDIRNRDDVQFCIKSEKPDVIFHVAGQVAMTTSLERPRFDFDINVGGTFNLLEAVRDHCPNASIVYSSTNKVYGDLEHLEYHESDTRYSIPKFPKGLPESIGLDFTTPYGCSKGAADQYMKDWAKCFGLKTVVFRHSSIFGGRQFSTFDQGWIGWFVSRAVETQRGNLKEPFTIQGNGKQVRDVLFSEDIVKCYWAAVENIEKTKGQSFNIGGGMDNSLSILELFAHLENEMGIKLDYKELAPRESDQKMFVADIAKAKEYFGWEPKVKTAEGLRKMIEWVKTI